MCYCLIINAGHTTTQKYTPPPVGARRERSRRTQAGCPYAARVFGSEAPRAQSLFSDRGEHKTESRKIRKILEAGQIPAVLPDGVGPADRPVRGAVGFRFSGSLLAGRGKTFVGAGRKKIFCPVGYCG